MVGVDFYEPIMVGVAFMAHDVLPTIINIPEEMTNIVPLIFT